MLRAMAAFPMSLSPPLPILANSPPLTPQSSLTHTSFENKLPAGVPACVDGLPELRGGAGVGGAGRDAQTRRVREQLAGQPAVRPADAFQGVHGTARGRFSARLRDADDPLIWTEATPLGAIRFGRHVTRKPRAPPHPSLLTTLISLCPPPPSLLTTLISRIPPPLAFLGRRLWKPSTWRWTSAISSAPPAGR